mmetsp:Transcript_25626/g.58832  ORF Transcript_25626/g.58832 Transcript_25626/m.58832 type:complete len:358 (-) Transcript_25626:272-1345(-)
MDSLSASGQQGGLVVRRDQGLFMTGNVNHFRPPFNVHRVSFRVQLGSVEQAFSIGRSQFLEVNVGLVGVHHVQRHFLRIPRPLAKSGFAHVVHQLEGIIKELMVTALPMPREDCFPSHCFFDFITIQHVKWGFFNKVTHHLVVLGHVALVHLIVNLGASTVGAIAKHGSVHPQSTLQLRAQHGSETVSLVTFLFVESLVRMLAPLLKVDTVHGSNGHLDGRLLELDQTRSSTKKVHGSMRARPKSLIHEPPHCVEGAQNHVKLIFAVERFTGVLGGSCIREFQNVFRDGASKLEASAVHNTSHSRILGKIGNFSSLGSISIAGGVLCCGLTQLESRFFGHELSSRVFVQEWSGFRSR